MDDPKGSSATPPASLLGAAERHDDQRDTRSDPIAKRPAAIDLDRILWDPEYREEIRKRLRRSTP